MIPILGLLLLYGICDAVLSELMLIHASVCWLHWIAEALIVTEICLLQRIRASDRIQTLFFSRSRASTGYGCAH